MDLEKRMPNHKTRAGHHCRVRRFVCLICGYHITIFADGTRDLVFDPGRAIEDFDKFQQEEQENDQ